MVDLSVIIVSWNVADLLADCLDSVFGNRGKLDMEVIVVDSASSDNSVSMILERFPEAILLAQSENVGFTHGNNIGLRKASGRYLLLLNPDTVILDDALSQMTDYLDANPEVGIVGPQTLNSDYSHQSTRRRFPTTTLAFFESSWLQTFAPKSMLSRYYVHDIDEDSIGEVDWVQGSAFMARREVYQQIGGLDEGYVMFSEELDWCKRAKDAGWRVTYLGTAKIIHHGGKSTDQVIAHKHIYFQESKLRYFRKYHGRPVAYTLKTFLLINYGWQIGLETIKSLLGNKRDMRRERIRAYWQVIRSGLKVT